MVYPNISKNYNDPDVPKHYRLLFFNSNIPDCVGDRLPGSAYALYAASYIGVIPGILEFYRCFTIYIGIYIRFPVYCEPVICPVGIDISGFVIGDKKFFARIAQGL